MNVGISYKRIKSYSNSLVDHEHNSDTSKKCSSYEGTDFLTLFCFKYFSYVIGAVQYLFYYDVKIIYPMKVYM